MRLLWVVGVVVVVSSCGPSREGPVDASTTLDGGFDAGGSDAGGSDAGPDSGVDAGFDAGVPDAGVPDAGVPDAGGSDGGCDAGFELIDGSCLATPVWRELHPTTPAPPVNICGMAWDTRRDRAVLVPRDDPHTWEWDGVNWAPHDLQVPLRSGHALAYDALRERTVLFGGAAGAPFGNLADTWEWDGQTWTERMPTTVPGVRMLHAMTWDAKRGVIVMFGGLALGVMLDDTWEWNGTNWTLRTPAHSPPGRAGHALAWDAKRERVVLFGGCCDLADTWEWDGTDWVERVTPTHPEYRANMSMAWDARRQRLVLFGGNGATVYGDTWEWDGATWLQRVTATAPSARDGYSMAADARGNILLVDGLQLGDTWLYAP